VDSSWRLWENCLPIPRGKSESSGPGNSRPRAVQFPPAFSFWSFGRFGTRGNGCCFRLRPKREKSKVASRLNPVTPSFEGNLGRQLAAGGLLISITARRQEKSGAALRLTP